VSDEPIGTVPASWGRAIARAAREAGRGALRRPLLPLASFGTLAVCLLLMGSFALLAYNFARLSTRWGGEGHMTVYLDDDTSSARAGQLLTAVQHLPGVTEARLVQPKEAHARLKAALGARGELLDGVDANLLPGSIDVRLRPGLGALLRAHPAFQRLATTAGVESVDLHAETTERLDRARSLLTRGAVGVGVLLLLATLYLVAATIRLGVEARREELAVLRLVGGTESFVRAPFLLEGLVTGLGGAAVALGTLFALYHGVGPRVTDALGAWLASAPISFFPPLACAAAVLAGGLLGLLGARAAFARELA
jgi:cell division transport system permease protein